MCETEYYLVSAPVLMVYKIKVRMSESVLRYE